MGAIGQGYDYHYPAGSAQRILTHATAFFNHSGFELVAGVDDSGEARKKFNDKFAVAALDSVDDLASVAPDIIAISTPTPSHCNTVLAALKTRPRMILIEKPLASNVEDSERILEAAHKGNCEIAVNFIRRFEPGTLALRDAIRRGTYGKVRKGMIWYSKGVLNNGSHFIDLCRYLLGEAEDVRILRPGRQFGRGDAEPDFAIRFGETDTYFLSGDENDFSVKEIYFLAERGIIRYEQGGERILFFPVEDSKLVSNYRNLSENPQRIETDFAHYQLHAVEHLYRCLCNGTTPVADGKSAYATQLIIEKILQERQLKQAS